MNIGDELSPVAYLERVQELERENAALRERISELVWETAS
jgi:uncharacterized protein (UPF0335 family)